MIRALEQLKQKVKKLLIQTKPKIMNMIQSHKI